MPDINSYALNLSFNINSNADVVFGQIEGQLTTINAQLEQTAEAASGAFDLSGAAASLNEVNASLTAALTALRDSSTHTDALRDDMSDMRDMSAVLTRETEKQSGYYTDMVGSTNAICNWLDKINVVGGIGFGFKTIRDTLMAVNEQMVQFSTLSRTLYGDQLQMAKQANRLSLEYNVFGTEAREAFVAVVDNIRLTDEALASLSGSMSNLNRIQKDTEYRLKLSRTAMKQYAEQAGQMSRVTGAAVETVVEWQGAVAAIGFNFEDTEKVMNSMVGAMKAAGMTSEQITKLLNQQAEGAQDLNLIWGTEGTKAIMQYQTHLAAAFTKVGIKPDAAVKAVQDVFSNSISAAALGERGVQKALEAGLDPSKVEIPGTDEYRRAVTFGYQQMMEDIENEIRLSGAHPDVAAQTIAGVYGINPAGIATLYEGYKRLGDVSDKGIEEFMVKKGLDKELKLAEAYADARNNIGGQLDELGGKMRSAWMLMVAQLTPHVMELIKLIMPLGDIFGKVAIWIDDFNEAAAGMTWPEYWGSLFTNIGQIIHDSSDESNWFLKMLGDMFKWLGSEAEPLFNNMVVWWDQFSTSAMAAWEDFSAVAGMIIGGFEDVIWWITFFGTIWEETSTAFVTFATYIWDNFWIGATVIDHFFNNFLEWVGSFITGWEGASEFFAGATLGMSDAIGVLFGWLGNIDVFIGSLFGLADGFFGSIGGLITSFWNTLQTGWSAITGGTTRVVNKAMTDANKAAAKSQAQTSKWTQKSANASVAARKKEMEQNRKTNAQSAAGLKEQMALERRQRAQRVAKTREGLGGMDAKGVAQAMDDELKKNNPIQNAMDRAKPDKVNKSLKESAAAMEKVTHKIIDGPKMSIAQFLQQKKSGQWTHWDPATQRAVRVETQKIGKAVPPEIKRKMAKAEPVVAPSKVHDEKTAKKAAERDKEKVAGEAAATSKKMAEAMEKEAGTKSVMEQVRDLLEDIKDQTGRSKSSVGGSHVTEWS
jgi:hypothetical protein